MQSNSARLPLPHRLAACVVSAMLLLPAAEAAGGPTQSEQSESGGSHALLLGIPGKESVHQALRYAGISESQVSPSMESSVIDAALANQRKWADGARVASDRLIQPTGALQLKDIPAANAQWDAGAAFARSALDQLLAAANADESTVSLARDLLAASYFRELSMPMIATIPIGATTEVVSMKYGLLDAAEPQLNQGGGEAAKIRTALRPYAEARAKSALAMRSAFFRSLAKEKLADAASKEWVAAAPEADRDKRESSAEWLAGLVSLSPVLVELSRALEVQQQGIRALEAALPAEVAWDVAASVVSGPQSDPPEGYMLIGPREPLSRAPQVLAVRNSYIEADQADLRRLIEAYAARRRALADIVRPFAGEEPPTAASIAALEETLRNTTAKLDPTEWRELSVKRQATAARFAAQALQARRTAEDGEKAKPAKAP